MIIVDCTEPGSFVPDCQHVWAGPERLKCRCCPARCERDSSGKIVAYDACTPDQDSEDLGYDPDADPLNLVTIEN